MTLHERQLRRFPPVAAAIVALIGVLVLFGWSFDVEVLKSLMHPERIAMNPATALSFLMCAVALWALRHEPPTAGAQRVARVCGALVTLMAASRLLGYVFDWTGGVDQILFRAQLLGNVMAPNTAASFLLVGLAMLVLDEETRRGFHPAQILVFAAGGVGLFSLAGYLYSSMSLTGMSGYIPMALNTAIAFTVLCAGLLCARPLREPVRTFVSDSLGGTMARRLVPAALFAPLLLGWLILHGARIGFYGLEAGLALFVLANIVVFNLLIWWCARVVHASDTHRRLSQDVLRQNEERHRAVMEQAAEGIYLIDLDTKQILDSNAALERLLGYEPGEARRMSVYDLVADAPANVQERLDRLVNAGEPLHGERPYRRKDGSLIDVEVSAAVISYGGRRVACTVVHDISERKRAQRELQEKNRLLEQTLVQLKQAQSFMVQSEKLAALGQMVAGVAHEINNPLAFVSNNVAVLQRDTRALCELIKLYEQSDALIAERNGELLAAIRALSDRVDLPYTIANLDDMLVRSRDGLRRIQQIVKDLRDFARLDESDLHEIDLNAGVESTINIIQGHAKKKRVTIDRHLTPLPMVTCHPAKVNQVIMNLLGNAIDACPEGGRVAVTTHANGDHVVIDVSDTGPGVPDTIRQRIFDPFFTTKPPGEGTGLGLSISYGIVKDHGGEIELVSAPGEGARFVVSLPVEQR
ncbi:MAG TPA: ATP-binding protein [Tepidisphaeraceae bacterium]|nr:ATP-binding protein [Tepidisphaeraceae bacterium]